MELVRKIEDLGEELFVRRMPLQLQAQARKRLAGMLWVIALAAGIVQLLLTGLLWRAGQRTNELIDAANYLSRLYGDNTVVGRPGLFFYVTVVLTAAVGVLTILAVPGLRTLRKATGWNYAFYALLGGLLAGMLKTFSDVNGGFGNLLATVLVTGVGGYVLFQTRSYFNGLPPAGADESAAEPSRPASPTNKDKAAKH